jgi:hypothetical protein
MSTKTMWKEVVVTCFKVLRMLSICMEEQWKLIKHLSHNDGSLGRDLNPKPSEYDAE